MITRRQVLIAVGALVARPVTYAQQPAAHRIGWLSNDRARNSPFFEAFREGMRDLGYIEGRNLVIEARFGDGSPERLDQLAVELARSGLQVLVAQGGPALRPLVKAGPAAPIAFGFSGDAVEAGYVDSLARPGRNLTGVVFYSLELVGKRIELLKEMVPGLKRVAVIANPEHPGDQAELRTSQAAAKALGITLEYFQTRNPVEIEQALAAIPKTHSQAILVFPDAVTLRNRETIATFAEKNRLPVVSGWSQYADSGCLMTYGPNLRTSFYRVATYVDKILKGAKPADLPVELPTRVELIVNMKTAKALGIKPPQSILLRADRVIE